MSLNNTKNYYNNLNNNLSYYNNLNYDLIKKINNDLDINLNKKNIYKKYDKNLLTILKKNNEIISLTIDQFMKEYNIEYNNNIFYNIWACFGNNNYIIINNNLINFVYNLNSITTSICLEKKKEKFLFSLQKKNIYYNSLKNKPNIVTYIISLENLKKYFYEEKNINKIEYILKIEYLHLNYQKYLKDKIIFKNENLFLSNKDFINNNIFNNIWNSFKYNYDILINYHMLRFIDFDNPCIQKTFSKTSNEKLFIQFLNINNIKFKEINYTHNDCFKYTFIKSFIYRNINHSKIYKKTWLLINLNEYKKLLNILKSSKKNQIKNYFYKIENLFNEYLDICKK